MSNRTAFAVLVLVAIIAAIAFGVGYRAGANDLGDCVLRTLEGYDQVGSCDRVGFWTGADL